MDIPGPSIIGSERTMAILASSELEGFLSQCRAEGRSPVIVHEMGGEKERAEIGPRELLENTRAMLAKLGRSEKWAAGGIVRSPEEGAQFAVAGCTWFQLELAPLCRQWVGEMTLDHLDRAIVAMEEQGIFAEGWHMDYVDKEVSVAGGAPVRFEDEELARVAVRFGPAISAAMQIEEVLRSCATGYGEAPDLVVSFAPSGPAVSAKEMVFLVKELRTRLTKLTAFLPPIGQEWEPGGDEPAEAAELLQGYVKVAGDAVVAWPAGNSSESVRHVNALEKCRLAVLAKIAREEPALFREWLNATREAFPMSRSGWPISLSEEEARFLPSVEDAELEPTFLQTLAGRQLLLSTWDEVRAGAIGMRAGKWLGAS